MDPIRLIIALCLLAYGIYNTSFVITLLSVSSGDTVLLAFLSKAVLAIAGAVAVWRRLAWDALAVVVLGAVVAASWLFDGFVLGIVAYLHALFAAIVALAVTLMIVAYLSGWFRFRVSIDSRSRRVS
jgi:hypothetical protein